MFSIKGDTMFYPNSHIFREHGQGLSALYGIGHTKKGGLQNINHCMNNDISNIENLFDNIISSLGLLLFNYSEANFDELDFLLEQPDYKDKIGKELLHIKSNTNHKFETKLREFIKHAFEGVQKSILQTIEYINTLDKLSKCKEKSSILDDKNKIIAYLEEKMKQIYLFDINPVTSISASLKLEYQEYIKRYGLPENLVFDTDKLTEIKEELNLI